jgi:hypothetical protein
VPSARRLTADEKKWMKLWRGHAHVVKSVNEAIEILTEDI